MFQDAMNPESLDLIIPDEDLPFVWTKNTPDEPEEDEISSVRTVDAWVVDLPDPRVTASMLKWLRTAGLDQDLSHLKRVRRDGISSTFLLCRDEKPPSLPCDLGLPSPRQMKVPSTAALSLSSAKIKSSIWPTVYAPRRKGLPVTWTAREVHWATSAMNAAVQEALTAKREGEIPIAAHIPNPLSEEGPASAGFTARDSRITAAHPLRHAVPNIVRCVADYHANAGSSSSMNGMNYLLTNLTVFLTHEPCIMCSMSLLHSRVKDVFYIFPMEKTGGCGGAACLPKLEGVNHRFNIYKWGGLDLLGQNVLDLRLNSELDA